jgi:hypothetical protein
MMDLLKLQPTEAERIAYAEGFPMAAELFARIADLQNALEQTVNALDSINRDAGTLKHARMIATEALARIEPITSAEGITL